jgi:hypothetical protein
MIITVHRLVYTWLLAASKGRAAVLKGSSTMRLSSSDCAIFSVNMIMDKVPEAVSLSGFTIEPYY